MRIICVEPCNYLQLSAWNNHEILKVQFSVSRTVQVQNYVVMEQWIPNSHEAQPSIKH